VRKSLKQYKSIKTLVIGGTGFIGSHLTEKLHELKSDVSIISRKGPITSGEIKAHHVNIWDTVAVDTIFKKNSYNVVFHCAGYSNHLDKYYKRDFACHNYEKSSSNILRAIAKYAPKTILVLLGSRLEYGTIHYLPVDEHHPTKPTSLYGKDKLVATKLTLQYYQSQRIPCIIFRLSNTYGPHHVFRFRNYNVINYFIDRAVQRKSLTIFGTGEQLKDYVYIDDVVNALLFAPFHPASYGQIYNIGYGKPITFKDMVKIIAERGKVDIQYKKWPREYQAIETTETENYYSDISKATEDLGWIPTISYKKGVELSFKCQQDTIFKKDHE